jgi:hypothetical protein
MDWYVAKIEGEADDQELAMRARSACEALTLDTTASVFFDDDRPAAFDCAWRQDGQSDGADFQSSGKSDRTLTTLETESSYSFMRGVAFDSA